MLKIKHSKRASTDPHTNLYEASIKVQGIVWLQKGMNKANRSDIIKVKSNNKIEYHCFKRYKSFPFTFNHIYDEVSDGDIYEGCFSSQNLAEAFHKNNDYMFFCFGSLVKNDRQLGSQSYRLFYDQLESCFNKLVKNQVYKMRVHAISVGEETVFDLISLKNVEIRQTMSNTSNLDIHFVGAQYQNIDTLYQLLTLIKNTTEKKQKNFLHSSFILDCQFTSSQGKPRRKATFIDGTKNMFEENKNWDNNNLLVLNKCILGLYNRMENKQAYSPYRDSKLTRIMKPFLTYNTKIDVLAFVNRDDDETSLSNLNLLKNLSRLKIFTDILENPQMIDSLQELKKQNQSIKLQLEQKNKQQSSSHQKINLFEEIRKNEAFQKRNLLKIQKIRRQKKIMRTNKWIRDLKIGLVQQSQSFKNLQSEEINHQQNLERSLIIQLNEIEKKRTQTINKSISKVQKLKLMKQYFTLALSSQKDQMKEFLSQQASMKKIYQDSIEKIQKNLKKKPSELIDSPFSSNKRLSNSRILTEKGETHKKRNFSSNHHNSSEKLPDIRNERKFILKKKVEKGRVEFQSFLQKNMEQYKAYQSINK